MLLLISKPSEFLPESRVCGVGFLVVGLFSSKFTLRSDYQNREESEQEKGGYIVNYHRQPGPQQTDTC